jgi:hypothetical protein
MYALKEVCIIMQDCGSAVGCLHHVVNMCAVTVKGDTSAALSAQLQDIPLTQQMAYERTKQLAVWALLLLMVAAHV